MNNRSGQVVLYLAFTLVAIAFLVLMNIGAFLGISARNSTMNSGDAAALAVARYQGELLNRIGELNVEHLKAALDHDAKKCEEIMVGQLRISFLDPIEGIRVGNDAARENGCDENTCVKGLLSRHADDVRSLYSANPDLYPEPWEGAWDEYAARIEAAISGGVWAGPDNIDFLDGMGGHLLLNQYFYYAIAGRDWCWFHFNAPGILDSYSSFRDWGPLPGRDLETRRRKCVNSEIYSLGLAVRTGSAVDLLGTNLIMRLTGATAEQIRSSPLLGDPSQRWFFFDTVDPWRVWTEIDPTGEAQFPAMGRVKTEYDVRGCAAVCRVKRKFSTVVDETEREAVWSGAAKPFGTTEDEDGETSVVTALKGLVTACFADTKLVPLDAVGGADCATADADWIDHVRRHLDGYLESGPSRSRDCWYCQQLVEWEKPAFRRAGSRWLRYHSRECVRPRGNGGGHGGSAHGH